MKLLVKQIQSELGDKFKNFDWSIEILKGNRYPIIRINDISLHSLNSEEFRDVINNELRLIKVYENIKGTQMLRVMMRDKDFIYEGFITVSEYREHYSHSNEDLPEGINKYVSYWNGL